ncbi:c-type cytochrome [Blastopirellula retiformator]|uniref:Cbb3-type cytochrome c oxidase subunit CcoP1 n=1 Tax=Blastopirellula retiformator TaxID=2527970 RepID=A0A5C5VJD0_9BACT|nr:c-type cytochrome [Blastopirellula retiformator]TWT38716.1 Cbb3-type cytochrome c oxidase subunit CcoP1 [Blastopirellula retiformator]
MPKTNITQALAALLLSTAAIVGCGKPDPTDRYVRPDEVTDFVKLFQTNCSGCHGAEGEMGPAPPLNDSLFQAIVSDEQLHDTIANGRPNTLMPAFANSNGGALTPEQVKIVVAGIRETWKASDAFSSNLPPYQVSADDPAGLRNADVASGKELFHTSCAKCHGDAGVGEEDGAGPLDDPSLARLMSDIELRRFIITGRPDLKMPDFATMGKQSHTGEPFTSEQISDITAYVRSLQKPGAVAAQRQVDQETAN